MGTSVSEVVNMVMNVRAINRAIDEVVKGKKVIYEGAGIKATANRGGWTKVVKDGFEFSVRSDKAREIVKKGKMRYSSIEDRLYSEWINSTVAGKQHSARRQVEGMRKMALKKGDMEMANALGDVLKKSDAKLSEWYDNWKSITSDSEIEEFYSYDTTQDFEDMLEGFLQS